MLEEDEELPVEIILLQKKVKFYKALEWSTLVIFYIFLLMIELFVDSLILLFTILIVPIIVGSILNRLTKRAETQLNDNYPVDERLLNFMNREPSELRQVIDYVDLGDQWPYYEESSELRVGIPKRGQIIEYVDLGEQWAYYEEPYELGEIIDQCTVCQLAIYEKEEVLKCPHCGASAHKSHLLEWVKIKGYCPNCSNNLNYINVLPIQEY